jgi:hypothetical protein
MLQTLHTSSQHSPKTSDNSKFTLPTTLALATLAVALPSTNITERATIAGSVNFFSRWDCSDPCTTTGWCTGDEVNLGDLKDGDNEWSRWDTGCWDRPAGTSSLSLKINNGHKITGINMSCAQWKKQTAANNYDAYSFALNVGPWKGGAACNVFPGERLQAVIYHWATD